VIDLVLGHIVVRPVPIAALSRSPGGAGIVADLMRRGTNVQMGARRYAGNRTGLLQASIVKRLEWRGVPVVIIGTDVAYARWHHEGSDPHVIRPRARQALRFPASAPNGLAVVFAKRVNHPGTKGTKFLVRALPLAAG